MNILAIETGSTICRVGLQFNGERSYRQLAIRSHSQVLLSLIDELLNAADASLEKLDAIAVNHGPGSFTGIRVGIAVAQGLAYANDIQLIGISSLKAVALVAHRSLCQQQAQSQSANTPAWVFATIDARMEQIYCGWYRYKAADGDEDNFELELRQQERVISPDQLHQVELPEQDAEHQYIMTGSGLSYQSGFPETYRDLNVVSEKEQGEGAEAECVLSAVLDLALMELNQLKAADDSPNYVLEPVYLRNNVTG